MAKAKAIVKVGGTNGAIVPAEDWEIALAAKAKDQKASEITGVPRITHRGGILKIDDKKVEGNKLPCVVVTYGLTKQFYAEGFDPDAPSATPVCYAFASAAPGAEGQMKPHEQAPEKQHDQCVGCQHNKFGTAEKGRGKRCSDTRKLLVLVGTNDPENVSKATVRQISVPPGSLKNWGNYLKSLDDTTPYGPAGVVTEITTEPSDNGGYYLCFKAIDRLAKDFVKAVYAKAAQVESELSTPFPVLEANEPKASKRSAKANRKVE